jgi:hypothetical protein
LPTACIHRVNGVSDELFKQSNGLLSTVVKRSLSREDGPGTFPHLSFIGDSNPLDLNR